MQTRTRKPTPDEETTLLSIGSEFLPLPARKVRDGETLTAAERAEYDAWAADQLAQMDAEQR